MNDLRPGSDTLDSETEITLGLLNAVHENSALTQRSMARELGIALGLANAYLKRCVKKGLIKVAQVPPNRYAYYLTPQGFTEKSRLTAEYLSSSFTFFRRARTQCAELFGRCTAQGWDRVALAGTGDLGEIATLCARDHAIRLVGFVDASASANTGADTGTVGAGRAPRFAGLPVAARLSDFGTVDAVLITDLRAPQATFEALMGEALVGEALAGEASTGGLPPERILAPSFLHITRPRPAVGGAAGGTAGETAGGAADSAAGGAA